MLSAGASSPNTEQQPNRTAFANFLLVYISFHHYTTRKVFYTNSHNSSAASIAPWYHSSALQTILAANLLYRCALVDCRNGRLLAIDTCLQLLPPIALAINALGNDTYYPPLPGPVAETCLPMFGKRCIDDLISPYWFVSVTFFDVMIIGVAAILWSVNTFGRWMSVFHRDRTSGQYCLFTSRCGINSVGMSRRFRSLLLVRSRDS